MQTETTYIKAVSLKYPEQVVLAIAKDDQGKCNPIALGWMTYCSGKPPMIAIAVGLAHHSCEAIRHARAFVVAFPSEDMGEDTLYFGTVSGRDVDKLAARGTTTQPTTEIDCVLLSDAVANFECVLEKDVVTGDHALFVGRVVASHVNTDPAIKRLYNLGAMKLRGLRGS